MVFAWITAQALGALAPLGLVPKSLWQPPLGGNAGAYLLNALFDIHISAFNYVCVCVAAMFGTP
jgi:hypothetical protein